MKRLIYCDQCNTPLFEVRDGYIILIARHHGEKHVSVINIADLLESERKESPDGPNQEPDRLDDTEGNSG